MKNTVDIRQRRITAIAAALDEAAAAAEDCMILMHLLRLKEQALSCRANTLNARRADRMLAREANALKTAVSCGDPSEILSILERIETGLFDRERPRSASRRDELTLTKRALFARLRQQAMQIDLWTARKQALVDTGLSPDLPAGKIHREEFLACSRRLRSVQNAFQQTLDMLRAMDNVLLMHSEEESLRRLEQLYADKLPNPDAFREQLWEIEIRGSMLSEKLDAINGEKSFFRNSEAARDFAPDAPLYSSESRENHEPIARSEYKDDHLQAASRHSSEALFSEDLREAECLRSSL